MEIILATWNKVKVSWLTKGFISSGLKIRPLHENEVEDVEESGNTSSANALIKVRAVGERMNSIIVGEDSILAIDALDGFPGVKTVRWSDGTDDDRSRRILKKLEGIPDKERGAKFQSAIALLLPDGTEKTFVGELHGMISNICKGEIGKGYQRIFVLPDGRSLAQSDSVLIQTDDHRDQAMKKASHYIKQWLQKKDSK